MSGQDFSDWYKSIPQITRYWFTGSVIVPLAARFGLVGATLAIEGPERVPAGWHALVEGQTDMILGPQRLARMGFHAPARGLFGARSEQVMSMAMVRVALWEPARQGVLAFGSPDAQGFAEDMGAELVAFLARVVERTAERWPVL